ncbi:M48 family metalloprotease [Sphingobacterium paludis]|uniref:Zn-dependent protease with chaperone function n=1 Tax=Sphingobacterium paludis TaxID=1476465 RepID=A0A4V3E263_9SPHI|nr:M48 family metalloprotease [Sphingobacterium paludis]TDS16018.1 Zn-dependent protease with chaperone function [Sphingobacterium paludis]
MILHFLIGCLIGFLICFSQWVVGKAIAFLLGKTMDSAILDEGKRGIPLLEFALFSISFGLLYMLSVCYDSNFITIILISSFISYKSILKPFFCALQSRNRTALFEQYILAKTNLQVAVVISPVKFINAYAFGALPFSRLIVMSEQLIEQLAETDVKAILLHEVGHLKGKHLLQLYLYNLFTAFTYYTLLIYFFRISTDFTIAEKFSCIIAGASVFGLLAYFIPVPIMKKFEYDADSYAAKKIGVGCYSRMLQNLDQLTQGALTQSDFYHPNLQQRLSKLKNEDTL